MTALPAFQVYESIQKRPVTIWFSGNHFPYQPYENIAPLGIGDIEILLRYPVPASWPAA